jgi:uncharacterized protein DUF4258
MSQNVIRFPGSQPSPSAPTATEMVKQIQKWANSGEPRRMRFDEPHFKQQLDARQLNMRQVLETVRKGCPVGTPKLDEWGDWRIKLRRKVAGRRVQVVVALKADHFVAVTAI